MTRVVFIIALLLPLTLLAARPAVAVEPDEILADSALETRAREISKGLRCVVCQNQSIDDSNAEIARDLRILVRERLLLGEDNKQVVNYVVARYGDYVLLKPPFRLSTSALWLGPPIMTVLAILVVFFAYRSMRNSQPIGHVEPLSPADRRRLDALVDQEIDRQARSEPSAIPASELRRNDHG